HASEEQATKGRLPNIEAAAGPLMRQWDDRPTVAGWGPYPSHWRLRAAEHVAVDPERYTVERVDPGIFNHAHPHLVFDELPAGTRISVEGLHERPIRLTVPEPPARIEVRIGEHVRPVPAPVDGLFLWIDAGKVVITQRARFGYVFQPEQVRRATVTMQRRS